MNWLLLRGLVREQRHWLDFPEKLAQHTGGRVLTLDLPGVGTERHRPSPTDLRGVVDDVRARFLRERGDGPWRIFAPSFGGMIALTWVAAYPDDFERIAVCNTSARDLVHPLRRLSPLGVWTVFRGLFLRDPIARERLILNLVANSEAAKPRAESFAGFALTAPVPKRTLFAQLFAALKAKTPPSLAPPLLVLASEGDKLCHPSASRALVARLNGTLHMHPTAGHDLPLDDPDWVARVLAGA